MVVSPSVIGRLVAILSAVAAPATVLAAETAGEREVEQSLFAGDIGNVFWTMLIFLGLLWVLGRYAWQPMLEALNRREQFIRDTLEKARKERSEAERMLVEYQATITRSKQEAQAIVDQGRKDAEMARQRLHEQAQSEAEQMVERAREEISVSRQAAVQDLRNLAADLSVEVASKIIQRNISPADQQRLVDESLKQLAGSNGDDHQWG